MKNTYKIVVLGPGGVGKTKGTNTLMHILQTLGFQTSEVKPWSEAMVTTSSYVIHNFNIPAGYFSDIDEPLRIILLDMGGQFKYRDMWEMHAEDTDGLIAVVDTTRKTTLQQIPLMLPKGIMEGVPVRLIVNKADLYHEFAQNAEEIANQVFAILQQVKSTGMVDYMIKYKGDDKFVFNNKIYRYGDQVPIMRQLKTDEDSQLIAKISDFEAIVSNGFKRAMPQITEHNSYLFGREFTLQLFDIIYKESGTGESLLNDELIETAHIEAPPFLSWGNDPDVTIPISNISYQHIKEAVDSMLIGEQDLWTMVERLRIIGYNIDVGDKQSWALTSAMLLDEDPNVNYKPMHKAVLPPFFIKKIVIYSKEKESEMEKFFV